MAMPRGCFCDRVFNDEPETDAGKKGWPQIGAVEPLAIDVDFEDNGDLVSGDACGRSSSDGLAGDGELYFDRVRVWPVCNGETLSAFVATTVEVLTNISNNVAVPGDDLCFEEGLLSVLQLSDNLDRRAMLVGDIYQRCLHTVASCRADELLGDSATLSPKHQ